MTFFLLLSKLGDRNNSSLSEIFSKKMYTVSLKHFLELDQLNFQYDLLSSATK